MKKIKISKNAFVYPMPMVVVGAIVDGKPNFMAVGWVSRVNNNPPMIAVALGKHHHTNKGISSNGVFTVNVPGKSLAVKTDYVGLISGAKIDKSKTFEVFNGELNNSPMIKDCPLNMECKVTQTVELPTNTVFIGEIINAYSEGKYLTNDKPDIKKIEPFALTMPDNNYWKIGKCIGKAWNMGKNLKK